MIAYAGLRTAKGAKGALRQAARRRPHLPDPVPSLLNVYAVLGLAPLTGVPLPFISSGSTTLVVLLCAMGLLLNIAGGGTAHLRAVSPGAARSDDEPAPMPPRDRDRRRRDGGPRRAGDRGRRRAAG